MDKAKDFEVLKGAYGRTGVWYRELPEEDVLRLASSLADEAPKEPARGLELAGGDVEFFDHRGSYLGRGSWVWRPAAFFPRGEDEPRLAPVAGGRARDGEG